jgi:hypothetical protein
VDDQQVNARLSASATLGIGYTTGSGGTVTQATNKSTAVTLNKVTGAITMNGAALGAGAKVSFTLNNNTILADDHLSVRIKSGNATADTYKVRARATRSGSAPSLWRTSAAAAVSEAVVVGFTSSGQRPPNRPAGWDGHHPKATRTATAFVRRGCKAERS